MKNIHLNPGGVIGAVSIGGGRDLYRGADFK